MIMNQLSDEELRTFVNDFVSGQIFSSAHLQNMDSMKTVFMPLVLGSSLDEKTVQSAGLIYEYLDAQEPMTVNGLPTFGSFRILHKDDWARARVAIEKEVARRKKIELPPKKRAKAEKTHVKAEKTRAKAEKRSARG